MNSQDTQHKNVIMLKNSTASSIDNKSLENTLRNRKIILQSGLKKSNEHKNNNNDQ